MAEYDEVEYELRLPWLDQSDYADAFEDQAAERLMLTLGGLTKDELNWWDGPLAGRTVRHERYTTVREDLGVEFYGYGHIEYGSGHVLGAIGSAFEAVPSTPCVVSPAEYCSWDENLRAALTALGITPHQDEAGWVLSAYYG
jgi:hypothetical protein